MVWPFLRPRLARLSRAAIDPIFAALFFAPLVVGAGLATDQARIVQPREAIGQATPPAR